MVELLYPLFPISAFLGFILVLIPLPMHLQAWNSGTCFYVFWTALGCLNQFVNSIVWANDAIIRAPVWCDISTRITLGAAVGIPASSLCIMRRLHSITKIQAVGLTHAEKRRAFIIDSCICILFPMIYLVLAYVVQGHRFDVLEQVGCFPVIYNTVPAFFLVHMWPTVLGICSAFFCVLTLMSFLRRQAQFGRFLSSNSSISASRYFRLMALACMEMICTTPLGIFLIVLNATSRPVAPWISWDDTHGNFSRIGQYPAVIWRSDKPAAMACMMTQWSCVICAFVFFIFFGFAAEARKQYTNALSRVLPTHYFRKPVSFSDEKPRLHKFQLPLHSPTSSTSSCTVAPHPPPPVYIPQSADPKISPSFSSDQNSLYMSYFKELPDTPTSPTMIIDSYCSSAV